MSYCYDSLRSEEYYGYLRSYNRQRERFAYIKTFGCQQNEADSEKISGILLDIGYKITESPERADLIILNTCSVRSHAEEKVFSLLGGYKEYKKQNPELIIGVVGCMGANSAARDMIKKSFHYVNFTLGAGVMHKLPELLYTVITTGKRRFLQPNERECIVEKIPTERTFGRTKYVSVMYGCDNFCSYCIVPYTRGRERSRESLDIINECRELIESGASEIMLLGQNVNSYRADIDFPKLLEKIASLSGDFTLRFMTSHPKDVSPRLCEVMAKYKDKIAPAFHLPLQSGSDRILKDMNRKYTKEAFIATADMIRSYVPTVFLTTDVIVGYPGESEEDFEDTLDVLSRVRFDAVYAFIYSARVGTRAALRTDTVEDAVKKERIARLLSLQDEILIKKNAELIGKTLTVCCEKWESDSRSSGRTKAGRLVHFDSPRDVSGEYVNVKITSVGAYDLIGTAEE